MEKFYNLIYRLRTINRWGTAFKFKEEDVAQHCYSVAIITHILCSIIIEAFNREVNVNDAVLYALYHDCYEAFTAHIVSPVKNTNADMQLCVENINYIYRKRLVESLPNELRINFNSIFNSIDIHTKDIVSKADLIDAYCKCKYEFMLGNKDFEEKYLIMDSKIQKLCSESDYVKYFFEQVIDFENLELHY